MFFLPLWNSQELTTLKRNLLLWNDQLVPLKVSPILDLPSFLHSLTIPLFISES